jgi:predicted nuclease of predicted toxin-antitoxin system
VNLVADEGVDAPIVHALRAAGFRVAYLAEVSPAAPDEYVLGLAREAESLLVTSDKDFGELVFRQGLTTAGVLLVRLHGLSLTAKVQVVVDALVRHQAEMLGAFSVVSPGLLRIRPRSSAGA